MLHMLSEDHKPRFFVRRHFLCRLPAEICSHLLQEDIKYPRALARKADKLWQNSNGTSLNALSDASEDQEVEDFSLLPPVLLHICLPVLFPVLSLGDQAHQDLVPMRDQDIIKTAVVTPFGLLGVYASSFWP